MISTPHDVESALTAGMSSPAGAFRYDVATDAWWWSDETHRIFGFEPGEIVPTTALVLAHLDPEDYENRLGRLRDRTLHGGTFASVHRILDANRQERVLATVGESHVSPEDGRVTHITGDLVDVTATMRALAGSEATRQIKAAEVHRAIIDQAVGVVMARLGVTPEQAFEKLREASMRTNVKLRVLAAQVVEDAVASGGAPGSLMNPSAQPGAPLPRR